MSVQAVQADSVKLFSPAILPLEGACGMEIIWKSLIKDVHTVERLWKGEKFPEVEGIHLMTSSGFLNTKKVNGMRSYYISFLRKMKIK